MARTVSADLKRPTVEVLLRSILRGGRAEELVKKGFSYWQISNLVTDALESKWLDGTTSTLRVTDAGLEMLKISADKHFWIDPLPDKKVAKLGVSDHYFPGQASLFTIEKRTRN